MIPFMTRALDLTLHQPAYIASFLMSLIVPANGDMAPVATPFFFYMLSGLAVAGGVLVITRSNPVHCALALIVTLIAVANLYLMLYAPFVAGVQIIVYAGGIMVLFLFVIMLVNIERASKDRRFNRMWPVGARPWWTANALD